MLVTKNELCKTTHHFSKGIYTREIFMPAGLLIIGKAHTTTHLNIIVSGSCDVMIAGEIHHIKAPYTFESLEGSQKTLYIYEDCVWMTVHTNEDDEKDVAILEDKLTDNTDVRPALMLEKINQLEERIEYVNVIFSDSGSRNEGDANKRPEQSSSLRS